METGVKVDGDRKIPQGGKEMGKVEETEMPRATGKLNQDSPVSSRKYMVKDFRVSKRRAYRI